MLKYTYTHIYLNTAFIMPEKYHISLLPPWVMDTYVWKDYNTKTDPEKEILFYLPYWIQMYIFQS